MADRRNPIHARLSMLCSMACIVACTPAAPPAPVAKPAAPAATSPAPAATPPAQELPTLARWREHLVRDLLPFWTHPDALGRPYGNFPTFRCNDGSAYRAEAPCPELAEAPPWVTNELDAEYTRMKSRQAFVYGVGFHVTGDPALLAHARAGVEYIRKHAYEPKTGSALSLWRKGQPDTGARTTQDLAYAQLGLAFYYYLTRDPEVLRDLVRLDEHLFKTYYEPAWGMLRWVTQDSGENHADQKELVAQLDPINAYLMLITPLLDEPLASAWRGHIEQLVKVIQNDYFAAEHGMFWGAIHSPERMALGTHHTDFGHTTKSLWIIYLAARQRNDPDAMRFALRHLEPLIKRAQNPNTGCWASTLRPDGSVDRSSNWWTSAELDQAVATLAMTEPRYRTYLARSYACWLDRFVDREHGEVWPFLPENGILPFKPAKVFHWKNGYHAAEHALIALITTAAMQDEPITLYYAFVRRPPAERIQPYLFRGTILADQPIDIPGQPHLAGRAIAFNNIEPPGPWPARATSHK